jgi:hypothetical protein
MSSGGFYPGDKGGIIVAPTTMAVDMSLDSADLGPFTEIALELHWSGANATNATMDIQASVSGQYFESYKNALYTLNGAYGTHLWRVILGAVPYINIVFSHGTNTTGTFSVIYRRETPT